MNFKKLESGRSMVEMLGVLAIIGVLSVGGIAGYSLSMRRHRANGVVDILSKYALIVYNQCQQEVLNGDSSDVTGCRFGTSFQNADIGALPAGLRTDQQPFLLRIENNATTGVDTVIIGASFTDKKLCETVASITATGLKSEESCENSGNLYIPFKQN